VRTRTEKRYCSTQPAALEPLLLLLLLLSWLLRLQAAVQQLRL
jgi:hypothetical protein